MIPTTLLELVGWFGDEEGRNVLVEEKEGRQEKRRNQRKKDVPVQDVEPPFLPLWSTVFESCSRRNY